MSKKTFLTVIITLIIALCSSVIGQEESNSNTLYGIKGGLYSPGTYYITDFSYGEFDTDLGFSIGGFVDTQLGERLLGGGSINISTLGVYEEGTSLIDFNVTLKAMFVNATGKMIFKPGIGFGYGTVGSVGDYIDGSSYLMLRGIFEVHFVQSNGKTYLAEIQLLGGSAGGGNDDFEMSFGPGFLLRGGLTF